MTSLAVAVYRGRIRKNIGVPVDDPESEIGWVRTQLSSLRFTNSRLASENKSLSAQVARLTHELSKARQIKRRHPTKLTCGDIVNVVAQYYEMSVHELMRKDNVPPFTLARMVVCYLARALTDLSLNEIGKQIGRNHASVSEGVRKTSLRRKTNPQLDQDIVQITFELERLAP